MFRGQRGTWHAWGVRHLWAILTVSFASCAEPTCKMVVRAPPQTVSQLDSPEDPKPRCDADDPECGPEPLERDGGFCFRPDAERHRVPPGAPPPARADQCRHDGECQIAGCGNVCVRYSRSSIETECIGYEWLDDRVLCGCVEGRCSFFE